MAELVDQAIVWLCGALIPTLAVLWWREYRRISEFARQALPIVGLALIAFALVCAFEFGRQTQQALQFETIKRDALAPNEDFLCHREGKCNFAVNYNTDIDKAVKSVAPPQQPFSPRNFVLMFIVFLGLFVIPRVAPPRSDTQNETR